MKLVDNREGGEGDFGATINEIGYRTAAAKFASSPFSAMKAFVLCRICARSLGKIITDTEKILNALL